MHACCPPGLNACTILNYLQILYRAQRVFAHSFIMHYAWVSPSFSFSLTLTDSLHIFFVDSMIIQSIQFFRIQRNFLTASIKNAISIESASQLAYNKCHGKEQRWILNECAITLNDCSQHMRSTSILLHINPSPSWTLVGCAQGNPNPNPNPSWTLVGCAQGKLLHSQESRQPYIQACTQLNAIMQ